MFIIVHHLLWLLTFMIRDFYDSFFIFHAASSCVMVFTIIQYLHHLHGVS